jgi:hypothetical protein
MIDTALAGPMVATVPMIVVTMSQTAMDPQIQKPGCIYLSNR